MQLPFEHQLRAFFARGLALSVLLLAVALPLACVWHCAAPHTPADATALLICQHGPTDDGAPPLVPFEVLRALQHLAPSALALGVMTLLPLAAALPQRVAAVCSAHALLLTPPPRPRA